MSDIKDPTWGDTGFDDSIDDGFLQPGPQSSHIPAESSTESRAETTAADHDQPRRLVVPPPPPPPARSRDHGGRGFRVALGALIVLIIALGGVLTWHLFFRVTPGVYDESPIVAERTIEPAPTEVPTVDTGVVVQAESSPSGAPSAPPPTSTPAIGPEATQLTTKKAPATNEPMYVVQVFSSPSRDDADEWVQILRTKNVGDVYVAEQPIKGQMWYRVRFGQFARREDAEFAAMKIGVSQPWIARIR